MEITIRERQGVRILDLVGRLTLGGGAKALYTAVREELESDNRWILLDLGQATLVDSTGLGVLVSCLTSAKSREGILELLNPSPKVEDVLQITQTDQLFEIFYDEDQAVQSFQDSR
jgi:anti-sigma B factor antagonist